MIKIYEKKEAGKKFIGDFVDELDYLNFLMAEGYSREEAEDMISDLVSIEHAHLKYEPYFMTGTRFFIIE